MLLGHSVHVHGRKALVQSGILTKSEGITLSRNLDSVPK